MTGAPNLVLIRHGESDWNVTGRATGWSDVALTERGRAQAAASGAALAAEGVRFDIIFTSLLRRATQTAARVAAAAHPPRPPVSLLWQLNERHLGQLQGLDKDAIRRRWGNDERRRWRSDPDALPPPLDLRDRRHPRHDARFAAVPERLLPASERISDVRRRVLAAWRAHILPALAIGSTVAVVAHRDSLRVLIMEIERIDIGEFAGVRVPPAEPRGYVLDGDPRLLCSRG